MTTARRWRWPRGPAQPVARRRARARARRKGVFIKRSRIGVRLGATVDQRASGSWVPSRAEPNADAALARGGEAWRFWGCARRIPAARGPLDEIRGLRHDSMRHDPTHRPLRQPRAGSLLLLHLVRDLSLHLLGRLRRAHLLLNRGGLGLRRQLQAAPARAASSCSGSALSAAAADRRWRHHPLARLALGRAGLLRRRHAGRAGACGAVRSLLPRPWTATGRRS